MNYTNIWGHYYPHEKRGTIYDGREMRRETVMIKGHELIQLTEPLKLYDKQVTKRTWLRNLEREINNANA